MKKATVTIIILFVLTLQTMSPMCQLDNVPTLPKDVTLIHQHFWKQTQAIEDTTEDLITINEELCELEEQNLSFDPAHKKRVSRNVVQYFQQLSDLTADLNTTILQHIEWSVEHQQNFQNNEFHTMMDTVQKIIGEQRLFDAYLSTIDQWEKDCTVQSCHKTVFTDDPLYHEHIKEKGAAIFQEAINLRFNKISPVHKDSPSSKITETTPYSPVQAEHTVGLSQPVIRENKTFPWCDMECDPCGMDQNDLLQILCVGKNDYGQSSTSGEISKGHKKTEQTGTITPVVHIKDTENNVMLNSLGRLVYAKNSDDLIKAMMHGLKLILLKTHLEEQMPNITTTKIFVSKVIEGLPIQAEELWYALSFFSLVQPTKDTFETCVAFTAACQLATKIGSDTPYGNRFNRLMKSVCDQRDKTIITKRINSYEDIMIQQSDLYNSYHSLLVENPLLLSHIDPEMHITLDGTHVATARSLFNSLFRTDRYNQ